MSSSFLQEPDGVFWGGHLRVSTQNPTVGCTGHQKLRTVVTVNRERTRAPLALGGCVETGKQWQSPLVKRS